MAKTKTKTITIQHFAGFVFDTPRNQIEDAHTIFSSDAHIKGGTEAGPAAPEYRKALAREARKNGYLFYNPGPQDCWVAFREDMRVPGSAVKKGLRLIIPSAHSQTPPDPHHYTAKGIPWMQVVTPFGDGLLFTHNDGHWLTNGRSPEQARQDNPRCRTDHYGYNTQMAHKTVALGQRKVKNGGWASNAADGNLVDRTSDVYRGAPATTCWDALKKWPPTGHGNIDFIGLLDKQGPGCKSKFVSARTMTDLDFNSDHIPVEAKVLLTWTIA